MENVNVPAPNPFITEWLKSPRCRAIVQESAELYEALYREVVAKRTGELAGSTHVSTGIENGRWVALMTVGVGGAPYAASHEFGTGRTDPGHTLPAANDLNSILNLMATL